MNIYAILHLVFWLLLTISCFVFFEIRYKIDKSSSILSVLNKKEENMDSYLDNLLDKYKFVQNKEKKYEKMLRLMNSKKTPRYITKCCILFSIFGIMISMSMQNLYIIIPLIIFFYQIPELYLELKSNKLIKNYNKSIIDFLQDFVTEYTTIKNVPNSIINVLPSVKSPLKEQLTLAMNQLNSGVPAEIVFNDLNKNNNNTALLIFSQLMIMHYKYGFEFIEEINKTIQTIREKSILIEENTVELTMVRVGNIILNLSIIIFYFVMKTLNPENIRLFTTTNQGKQIIFFIVISSLLSLFMGSKIAKIRI